TTDTGGSTAVNGGAITTTGAQTYNDAMTLGTTAATLASTGGGAITFNSTVQGPQGLTVNTAGATTFNQAVGGGGNALANLSTDAAGTTAINGGAVNTAGAQSYGDAVTLGTDTTITGTGNTFSSTVNSAGANRALTVNDSGTTTFGGLVGS